MLEQYELTWYPKKGYQVNSYMHQKGITTTEYSVLSSRKLATFSGSQSVPLCGLHFAVHAFEFTLCRFHLAVYT